MNQKNLFSAIGAVLVIQGIAFFIMNSQLIASSFPAVDETGRQSLSKLFEVMAAFSILTGLITYASRMSPNVSWAFTLGSLVLILVTFKHKFMDEINVPIPAMVIQVLMLLAFAYVWSQEKKRVVGVQV